MSERVKEILREAQAVCKEVFKESNPALVVEVAKVIQLDRRQGSGVASVRKLSGDTVVQEARKTPRAPLLPTLPKKAVAKPAVKKPARKR